MYSGTTHELTAGGVAATYNDMAYNGKADGSMASGGEAKSGKASRQKGRRGTAAPTDDVPALAAASDSDDSDAEPEPETTKTVAHGVHGNEAGVAHTGAKHFEGGSAASPPAGVDASGPPMLSGNAGQRTGTDADAAIRPPQRLQSQQIAAAAALGMTSAGLAWRQQAEHADAARHAAGGTTDAAQRAGGASSTREREERGRATADVPLRGEPPRYEREITLPPPRGVRVAAIRVRVLVRALGRGA